MSEFASCPQCGGDSAEAMNFTWWGGAIGPRVLSHVKCNACGKAYNGKTGGDNTVGILVYTAITGVLALALLFAVFFVWARLG